jgi:hypothetical protein
MQFSVRTHAVDNFTVPNLAYSINSIVTFSLKCIIELCNSLSLIILCRPDGCDLIKRCGVWIGYWIYWTRRLKFLN